MNTPNKLTIARTLLVPVFMIFLLDSAIPYHMLIAAGCFIAASLTDLLDGKLARKNNQVTDFGRFLDPLADKLLVIAALVCFVQLNLADAWITMIIILRELMVTSIRLIASGSGKVIAANIWGKAKTVSQMTAIITVMGLNVFHLPPFPGTVLLWVAALFTIISGAQYVWTYREYIDTTK